VRLINNIIEFTNGQPTKYDWLGEITWVAPPRCEYCGDLEEKDISLETGLYDGMRCESPFCKQCNRRIQGEPKDPIEKESFYKQRPNLKKINWE